METGLRCMGILKKRKGVIDGRGLRETGKEESQGRGA